MSGGREGLVDTGREGRHLVQRENDWDWVGKGVGQVSSTEGGSTGGPHALEDDSVGWHGLQLLPGLFNPLPMQIWLAARKFSRY